MVNTPDLGIPEWFTKRAGVVWMEDLDTSEIQELVDNLKHTKMAKVIRGKSIEESVNIWIDHFNEELIKRRK